jgi:hypothetical protein
VRWAGYVARRGEKIKTYGALMEKGEGNRILRRPRRRYEHNIKIHVKEVRWESL